MKTVFKLILALMFLSPALLHSQPVQKWAERYNSPNNDWDIANSMVVDPDGGIYVTGSSKGANTFNNFNTVKYDSNGNMLWVKTYDGPAQNHDFARGIAIDNNNSVYVIGESQGIGTGADFCVVKYSSSGTEEWVRRFDSPTNSDDKPSAVTVDAMGNVIVVGSGNWFPGNTDYIIVKYDANGNSVFTARYDTQHNFTDKAVDVATDNHGNIYVTGFSDEGNGWHFDYTTIKFAPNGLPLWTSRYNGTGSDHDYPSTIAVDQQGNAYVTGTSIGMGTNFDYATVKYDSSGNEMWAKRYTGPGSFEDYSHDIVVDQNGNSYITGESKQDANNKDFATIKYDANGNEMWTKRYNSPSNLIDGGFDIDLDDNGNVLAGGYSFNTTSQADGAIIKYDANGNLVWMETYNGPANNVDNFYSIKAGPNGNIYAAGYTALTVNSSISYDFVTIRYSDIISSIQNITSQTPEGFELSQNYPNPFNPSTKISFSIPSSGLTKLTVFDISGREITQLVNEELNSGTYEYTFDAGNLTSGAYFYRIEANSFTETKKMLLIK